MSKKFFAKKFVAYSMAFAVAFASVNVSPVFVKDAQAAAAAITKIATDSFIVGNIRNSGVAPPAEPERWPYCHLGDT